MKKYMVPVLMVLLVLSSAFALAEEDVSKEEAIDAIAEARYDLRVAELTVAMDSVISHISGLGGDTTELEALQTDFQDLVAVTESKDDKALLREVVKNFKDAGAEQMDILEANSNVLKVTVQEAIEADSDVQLAKGNLADVMADIILERYDNHLDRMEEVVLDMAILHADDLTEEQKDTLNAFVDDYAAMRVELEIAVNSGDADAVSGVIDQLREINQGLRAELNSLRGTL